MKFNITIGFKNDAGYLTEDIITLYADNEKEARKLAKKLLKSTIDIKAVNQA